MSYPLPADVRLGVQYGPTGTEYTGTMVSGFASRMTVTLTTERLSVTERPRKQAQQVTLPAVQQITRKQAQQSVEPKLTVERAYVLTAAQGVRIVTRTDEWWLRTNKETL